VSWDSTVGKFKIGNGTSPWSALAYQGDAALSGKANSSHTHGAADINSGTLPDARLPARLNTVANGNITDWNQAITNGWYMGYNLPNSPTTGVWYIGNAVAHNGLWVTQTVYAFTGDSASDTQTWRRSSSDVGGTISWGAWYKLMLSQAESDARYVLNSSKAVANGIASLGSDGKVPTAQLPPAVLGTSQLGTFAARPAANTVSAGTIYYATNVAEQYRSNGTIWQVVGSGGNELAYAELGTNFTTASTSKVDVTGLTVTFVAGERPIEARVTALVQAEAAGGRPGLHILLDNVVVGEVPNRIDPTAYGYMVFERIRRLPAMTPGSTHTIKIQASSTGGNITVFGVSANPAELSVTNR
jgi:hypothetical protein